ncbi:MAG: hypothetical protein AAF598_08645 [Bacteroidota bacterium]
MKPQLHYFAVLTLLLIGLSVGSCGLVDPDEQIPGYLHIEPWTIDAQGGQGTEEQRITDVWVAIDDQLVGAFFLPVTIPVLAEGPTEVSLFPGIIENGITNTRDIYPFFNQLSFTNDFVPLQVDSIFPTTTYRSNTVFVFVEDFEGSNLFGQDVDGNANTRLELTTQDVFEGSASGVFTLIGDDALGIAATSLLFDLPTSDTPIFLELHFKTDLQFSVGVVGTFIDGTQQFVPKLTLTPRDDWRKVYVNIEPEVQALGARDYQVYFTATKPNDMETATILLDNIKLLHF